MYIRVYAIYVHICLYTLYMYMYMLCIFYCIYVYVCIYKCETLNIDAFHTLPPFGTPRTKVDGEVDAQHEASLATCCPAFFILLFRTVYAC